MRALLYWSVGVVIFHGIGYAALFLWAARDPEFRRRFDEKPDLARNKKEP